MNRFAAVAGLVLGLSACGDDADAVCLTKNAVRDETGTCACPKGTHIEVSVCERDDAGVDVAFTPATDSGRVERLPSADARSIDAGGKAVQDAAPSAVDPLERDAAQVQGEDAATAVDAAPLPAPDAGVQMGTMPSACLPAAEHCNAKDDDCDGRIDEDVSEAPLGKLCSNNGQGACTMMGMQVCVAGAVICNAPPPTPRPELCDGIDNDCKNGVDDTFANKGKACAAGKDDCLGAGIWECDPADPTNLRCTAVEKPKTCPATGSCAPVPTAEDCSTPIDDNCNGVINGAGEGCCTPHTWYPDCDGDGFAVNQPSAPSCSPPASSPCPRPLPSLVDPAASRWLSAAPVRADCQDTNAEYRPGQTAFVKALSGNDPNCDGMSERQRVGDRIVVIDEAANLAVSLCPSADACPCYASVSASQPDLSNRGFLCDGGYYTVSLLDASCAATSTTRLVTQLCR